MFAILHALGMFVADLFKSRSRLEAENLFLRHQLAIALRRAPPRFRLRGPGPATATVVRGDTAPDGRVAGPTDRRGFPLGISAGLSGPRQ